MYIFVNTIVQTPSVCVGMCVAFRHRLCACVHIFLSENELYSTLHTNHAYDVNLDGLSNRGSHAGSGVMYVYNGGAGKKLDGHKCKSASQ